MIHLVWILIIIGSGVNEHNKWHFSSQQDCLDYANIIVKDAHEKETTAGCFVGYTNRMEVTIEGDTKNLKRGQ